MNKNIGFLKQLGLTEYESKVYICLVQFGAVTGYKASKLSAVPKANCYAALNSLVQKGYVYKIEGDSVLFSARDFSELKQQLQRELELKLSYLSSNLKQLNSESKQFINVEGSKNIKNKIISLINSAQRTVYLDIWQQDLGDITPFLLKAKLRSVNCVLICLGNSTKREKEAVNYILEHDVDKQWNSEKQRDFNLIVDNKLAFSGDIENSVANAVFSANVSFVNLATEAFIHDLYTEKMKEVLEQNSLVLEQVKKQLNNILKE
ncbi:TrmB family transcriptional regulator [Clostridium sp. 'deep sea']|uniref:TrmB family transcriptional regulator n=1 Tax=Clostridium sp. 'deep sea' TaxID=2779445 RepID=UPI0018969F8F|nr:TrmB family transcriptional regulator [Clostridium sp. 'deep sea']QOR35471.1 TrmB family transcriptional regulator [Clostridium sp. 'deep sea']